MFQPPDLIKQKVLLVAYLRIYSLFFHPDSTVCQQAGIGPFFIKINY